MKKIDVQVRETRSFHKVFDKLVGNKERVKLHEHLISNPESGVVIRKSNGARKLRWKRLGSGKSGGVRVIYYYYGADSTLYLITLFAKSDKGNLTAAQINDLAKTIDIIKNYHKGD